MAASSIKALHTKLLIDKNSNRQQLVWVLGKHFFNCSKKKKKKKICQKSQLKR
jgi:hypothetical protein